MKISVKDKDRAPGGNPDSTMWTDPDGTQVFIGRDWALHNEIQDAKALTKTRSCFRECHTCGCCANSCRDSSHSKSYDAHTKKWVGCKGCEPFRWHDCHNGFMRNSRGEAEPFTQ